MCVFFKGKNIFPSLAERQTDHTIIKNYLKLYAPQNYDLEEEKCSAKLQRQHDVQHLVQTDLYHWAAFDYCVVQPSVHLATLGCVVVVN